MEGGQLHAPIRCLRVNALDYSYSVLYFIPLKEEYVAVFRGSGSGLGRAFTLGC